MWKEEASRLRKWLAGMPNYSAGAKPFLQGRFGVTPAIPFTPVMAFGLEIEDPEMMTAPVVRTGAVTLAGASNPNS